MSTAGLEELLLQDFHAREHGEAGMDHLYQAARVLADREPDSSSAADRAWERFQENYLPFVSVLSEDGTQPSSDAAPGRRYPSWRRGIHVAGVAAVLCGLLLSISLTAAAGGYDLWRKLASWTDEEIWLNPGQTIPMDQDDIHLPEELGENVTLQEALEACGLTRHIAPSWLPEGFEPDELVIDDQSDPSHIMVVTHYRRGEDSLLLSVDIFLDTEEDTPSPGSQFQKDEGNPVPYEAGGVTHLLVTNAGRPVAVWTNGPVECGLTGDITMRELKQIIDSIYQ